MIAMGIDPDTKACAFALVESVEGNPVLKACFLVRQSEGTGRERAVKMAQNLHEMLSTQMYEWFYTPCAPDDEVDIYLTVVEGQDIRYTGRSSDANPQSLCDLSLVAGAAIANAYGKVLSPLPHDWKGSVPKSIKQQRILKRLGIEYTMTSGKDAYPVPVDADKYTVGKVNQADWKDLTDAIGLAVWGLEQEGLLNKEQKHVAH